jgi:hypothetical protein
VKSQANSSEDVMQQEHQNKIMALLDNAASLTKPNQQTLVKKK